MNLVQDALKLLNKGLSVFPVSNTTKTPIVPWDELQEHLPTREQVIEWFTPNNRSIGIATGPVSKALLLDFDVKHPEAMAYLKGLQLPLTWKEQTGSGGIHVYFSWVPELDSRQCNTTSLIAKGVDTKGYGGYSKIAPSKGYRWLNSPFTTTLARPPQWLIDLMPSRELIVNDAHRAGKSTIAQLMESVQEGNRNNTFTKIAGSLRARGYKAEEIYMFLKPKADEVVFPDKELRIICDSVGKYKPRVEEVPTTGKFSSMLADKERVEWLCRPLIARNSIAFVAGLPKVQKTWLMMDFAIELAKGGLWLDRYQLPQSKVLFIDQERPKAETYRRFRALCAGKNVNPDDLDEWLTLKCKTTFRIDLQPSFEALKKVLSDERPDIVIVDSFATFHTKEESNRTEIQHVLEGIKALRNEFNCAFVIIHHETKAAIQSAKDGNEPSYLDMAGNVAIAAAAEHIFNVKRQDVDSCMVYHTANNLGEMILPLLIKVTDLDEAKTKIKVEAF